MIESDLAELEYLEPQRPAPRLEENPWQLLRRRDNRTTFYVWGYGRPWNVAVGPAFHETPAARRFAAQRGWVAERPGAWARECRLELPFSKAIRRCADTLRLDAAVAGWGLEMTNDD